MMCSCAFFNVLVFSNNYSELVLSLKCGCTVVEATGNLPELKKAEVSLLDSERDLYPVVDLLK